MFFDDIQLIRKKDVSIRVPPPVPATGWHPPEQFPNLDGAQAIGFDVETKETDFTHGPGWSRGPKGHIVGVSLAAIDRHNNRGSWYFPVRHEVGTEHNLDAKSVFAYVKHVLENPHTHKVGANIMYDMGWLGEEGIAVKGELHDVQFAQALIDEQSQTDLDYLASLYLGEGKVTSLLYDWCRNAYGGKIDQRKNIFRAPPALVGPYAEGDALKPLDILERQYPIIRAEELTEIYKTEHDLIPILLQMRRNGVRVDINRCEQLLTKFQKDAIALRQALADECGFQINPNSPIDCAKAFDAFAIPYLRTEDGNPSFSKEFLNEIEHPIGKAINEIRAIEKVSGTFLRNYLLEGNVNGRIHCQFHPLRTANDDGSSGAKTGRFASSDPNLQNIPVRTKAGKQVRTCFVCDAGDDDWLKKDYSQIEYRMLAHFAVDSGDGSAERLRQTYINDPKTDYHDNVFIAFCKRRGLDWQNMPREEKSDRRKPIKNINFGLLYGQSAKSLAFKAGMAAAEAKGFFADYHISAPYVEPTMKAVTGEVNQFGYVRTITGRRTRFNMWQDSHNRKSPALPYDAAIREYGYSIERAWAYRGTNYKFQGSAADIIKRAMVKAHKDGVFDFIGYPKLQVHDELDFSRRDKHNPQMIEAYKYLDYVLENSTPCNVPVIVSTSEGDTWGAAE